MCVRERERERERVSVPMHVNMCELAYLCVVGMDDIGANQSQLLPSKIMMKYATGSENDIQYCSSAINLEALIEYHYTHGISIAMNQYYIYIIITETSNSGKKKTVGLPPLVPNYFRI